MFLPHPRVNVSIVGSLRDREVACSASDRQGSNFESCVWRTVSSQSSHHPQEVLLPFLLPTIYIRYKALPSDNKIQQISPFTVITAARQPCIFRVFTIFTCFLFVDIPRTQCNVGSDHKKTQSKQIYAT